MTSVTERTSAEIQGLALTKAFNVGTSEHRTLALDHVDFRVEANEFFCILGPSGCGKSTLLNMIAGFTSVTSGSLLVRGSAVRGPGSDRTVVFQEYGLFPWKTLRENVEFGLKAKGLPRTEQREVAEHYIELVRLSEHADKFPHEVSGGMKQRCGVARALAPDPEIVLMDEPFGALDSQTRERLQEEILDIWDEASRKTIVFITHSIEEALFLGDRIMIMTSHPGRIKEVIDVALPRPRLPEVRNDRTFLALKEHIWSTLRSAIPSQHG